MVGIEVVVVVGVQDVSGRRKEETLLGVSGLNGWRGGKQEMGGGV